MIDRSEGTGLTIALAGHVVLFGLLSVGFLATPNAERFRNAPIEVTISDEVALESTAPELSTEMPSAGGQPEDVPDPTPPEPVPDPEPVARPDTPRRTVPDPAAREQPKQQSRASNRESAQRPAQPNQNNRRVAPSDRLANLDLGPGERETPNRSNGLPASRIGPEVRSSLAAEIRRQLKPHWRAPTGADSDQLVTLVRVQLAEDGSIVSVGDCRNPPGSVTASNRGQVRLHCENAKRAIQLAAPFRLPREFYAAWKTIEPSFDRRLSL